MKTYEEWCAETAPVMAAVGRGEKIEFRVRFIDNEDFSSWLPATTKCDLSFIYTNEGNYYQYQIEPKTIMIGDVEVPEPLRIAPDIGNGFYYPDIVLSVSAHSFGIAFTVWVDDEWDNMMLNRGLVHLTRDAAIQHAKALIKISVGKIDES